MTLMTLTTRSPEETRRFGAALAGRLRPGDVVALTGRIGSGKTTLVKGLAEGLGIPPEKVASPSFVLIREYAGRLRMAHADLFRLDRLAGAETVGLEEYYGTDWITVVEWADQVPGILPEERLVIRFETLGPEIRRLILDPRGASYAERTWP